MRRGQSSIEIVMAVTLLSILLTAGTCGAVGAWRSAEASVARLAAQRTASRGGDPERAAAAVLPPLLRPLAPSIVRAPR